MRGPDEIKKNNEKEIANRVDNLEQFAGEQCEETPEELKQGKDDPAKEAQKEPQAELPENRFFTGEKVVTIIFSNGAQMQCGKLQPHQLELVVTANTQMLRYYNERSDEYTYINYASILMLVCSPERMIQDPSTAAKPNIIQ